MINRSNVFRPLCFCLTLLVSLAASVSAQNATEVVISVEQIAENIYMLSGRGGNTAVLVGGDGSFVIDHPNADVYEQIIARIDSLGGSPVRYLLNTHYHRDHTGGNELIKKAGALIIAHENVRNRQVAGNSIAYFEIQHPPLDEPWLPAITFDNSITFHFNGEPIEIFHPGQAHTDGDAVAYLKNANVVHVGDIFFNTVYPFMDLENGGNFDGLIAAIDKILGRINETTTVIPGHGPVTDYTGFKAYRDMLATIVERVKTQLASGKSLQEIIAARPTSEFDRANEGFIPADDLVKFVYEDLTARWKQ
ncbi:MAG: MBL fold metallo-hydrolase [Candidatus Zixiibacteriota bacterium]|nr:MAG: MBL fold metallo-hydrolase [candidate division Zixibacteria bacterium]